MKVTVEISDDELKREILNLVAKDYKAEYQADRRKIDVISPSQYGAFLQKRGKRR